MNRDLEDRAAEAAAEAKCERCRVVVMDDPSRNAMMIAYFRIPALDYVHPYQLCGRCGMLLREFLRPGLAESALYAETRRMLFEELWK